jgi:hypothetical protein
LPKNICLSGLNKALALFFTSIDFFRKKLMCNGEYFFIIEVMKIFQQFAKAIFIKEFKLPILKKLVIICITHWAHGAVRLKGN